MLTKKVQNIIKKEQVSGLEMSHVEATTPNVTEMLAALIRLSIDQNGLKKFRLEDFGCQMTSRIDLSITQEIIAQCKNL